MAQSERKEPHGYRKRDSQEGKMKCQARARTRTTMISTKLVVPP